MIKYSKNQYAKPKNDSGSVFIMLAAVVLPLMFVLMSVTVEVSSYYTSFRNAQQLVDSSVLYAQRFLPFTAAADQALQSFLTSKGVAAADIQTFVENDRLQVEVTHRAPLLFASLFGVQQGVESPVVSGARVAPLSVSIIMDVGSSSSPQMNASGGWDYSGSPWPSAQLFNSFQVDHLDKATGLPFTINSEVASQQCFNPLLSAIKRSALRLFDYYSASPGNNLSLLAGPMQGDRFADLMTSATMPAAQDASPFIFDRFQGADANGQLQAGMRGDYCLAAANESTPGIAFPGSVAIPGVWQPQNTVEPLTDSSTNLYSNNYAPFLTAEQAIWGQSANSYDALEIPSAFGFMKAATLAPAQNDERGALVGRTKHVAFMLLSDLPHASTGERYPHPNAVAELDAELAAFRNDALLLGREVNLVALLFFSGDSGSAAGPSTAAARAQLIQHFRNNSQLQGFEDIKVDAEELNLQSNYEDRLEQLVSRYSAYFRSAALWK